MLSVMIYAGIACLIFYIINWMEGSFKGHSFLELGIYFLLMRVVPLLMLEERIAMNYIIFASDILFMLAFSYVSAKVFGGNKGKIAAAMYLFEPAVIFALAKGNISLFFILAVCSAVLIYIILKISLKIKPHKKKENAENNQLIPEKVGKKDFIFILILTAFSVITIFFRLGCTEIPLTYQKVEKGNEIILDLGEYKDIASVDVFLNYKSGVNMALSVFNEMTGEWISVSEDNTLINCLTWTELKVNWNARYLGIVFTNEGEYYINELVVYDTEGELIEPLNADEYPKLFDERELIPKYKTYYYGAMFDEVYHARTAYEFKYDLPIYEKTHPPLGKTLISIGISLFGTSPYGWRFIPAVCGVLAVPLMYIFIRLISKRSDIAFFGGVIFSTEFMHLTLSRIATLDIIIALLIMLMFLFMYCFTEELGRGGDLRRQSVWLLLCGISTALAVAVKWTGVYAVLGIALLFFISLTEHCNENGGFIANKRYILKLATVCVISFIALPLTVYSLSYIQFSEIYPDKNFIAHAIENSKYMLNYHSEMNRTHIDMSEWYEWIIDRRSLLDSFTIVGDNISTVSTLINPLTAICGAAAFIHNFYLWRRKDDKVSRFLVIVYIAMLMPWLFIHRTVFIYQYFGCILVIIPMICKSVMSMKHYRKISATLMIISAVLFIMFYPVISGIEVSRSYVSKVLEWLPTWRFE